MRASPTKARSAPSWCKDGKIIGEGVNQVVPTGDPTAHAEVVAIRAACEAIGSHVLDGAVLYTSCEPCPMCLGAAWWARD